MESDTCLVVVTVFKIVAPALCAGGWVRFPPSPPTFARACSLRRALQPTSDVGRRVARGVPAAMADLMKTSRLRAIPSVDKVLQSLGDTGLPAPVVVDAVRRHLKTLRSKKDDSSRRCDRRGHPFEPAEPACVPPHAGDQRDRDSRPHQSRPGAARVRQHSRALGDRGQLQHARIQLSPPAPAAAARRIWNTAWRFSAVPKRPRWSTTMPRRWSSSSTTSVERRRSRSSSRAASCSRSGAASAFPSCSRRAARGFAKWARPIRPALRLRPRHRSQHGAHPESASQQLLHGGLRRVSVNGGSGSAGSTQTGSVRRGSRERRDRPDGDCRGSGARADPGGGHPARRRSGVLQRRQTVRWATGGHHRWPQADDRRAQAGAAVPCASMRQADPVGARVDGGYLSARRHADSGRRDDAGRQRRAARPR